MPKILTIILVLLAYFPLKAQSYLNETCAWYGFDGDAMDNYLIISKYEIKGDTIINGKKYWKLFQHSDHYWGGSDIPSISGLSLDFIRDEGGVFYKWGEMQEDTVISFNLEVGDSIIPIGSYPQVIASIDSFSFGGAYRKIFTTTWGYTIYEGIGTNFSVANGLNYIGDENFGVMRCFSKDGETVQLSTLDFGFWQIEPCDSVLMTNSGEVPIAQAVTTIYPNPITAKFHLTSTIDLEHAAFELFDISGRPQGIESKSIQSNTVEIELDLGLPSGIYFLSIEQNGLMHWEKLVKQ